LTTFFTATLAQTGELNSGTKIPPDMPVGEEVDKVLDPAAGRHGIIAIQSLSDHLHELVSDTARLYRMTVDMRKQVLRHRKVTLQSTEGAQRTIDGHRKILLALRLKDPELCEKTMREHIKLAKEDALLALMREA